MGLNFDDENNVENGNGENLFEEFEDSIITEDSSLDDVPEKKQNRTFIMAVTILGGGFLIVLIALIVYSMMTLPQRSAQQREDNMLVYAEASATAQEMTLQAVSIALQPSPTDSEVDDEEDLPEVLATEVPTDELPDVPAADITSEGEDSADEPPADGDDTSDTGEATNTPLPVLTNTLPVAEVLDEDDRQATLDQLLTVLAAGGTETSTPDPGEGVDEAATPLAGSDALTATAIAAGVQGGAATPVVLPETGFVDEGLPYLLGGALLMVILIIVVRRLRLARIR